jgi:hypothetical protein
MRATRVSGAGHLVSCRSVLFNDISLATPTALAAGLPFACTGNARSGYTSFRVSQIGGLCRVMGIGIGIGSAQRWRVYETAY